MLGVFGAFLSLTAVGCGGGSSGPTREQFVDEVNVVCRAATAESTRLARIELTPRLQAAPEADAPKIIVGHLRRTGVPIARRSLARLEPITPPESLEEEWSEFMVVQRDGPQLIERTAQVIESGDPETLARFRADQEKLARPLNEFADRVGLTDCITSSGREALDG